MRENDEAYSLAMVNRTFYFMQIINLRVGNCWNDSRFAQERLITIKPSHLTLPVMRRNITTTSSKRSQKHLACTMNCQIKCQLVAVAKIYGLFFLFLMDIHFYGHPNPATGLNSEQASEVTPTSDRR